MSKMIRLVENLSLLMEEPFKEISRKTVQLIKFAARDPETRKMKKQSIPKNTKVVKLEFSKGIAEDPSKDSTVKMFYVAKDKSIQTLVVRTRSLVEYLGIPMITRQEFEEMVATGKATTIFGDPVDVTGVDKDFVPSWPLVFSNFQEIKEIQNRLEKMRTRKPLDVPDWHDEKDVKSGAVEMHNEIEKWNPSEKGYYRKSDLPWAAAFLKIMKRFGVAKKYSKYREDHSNNTFGTKYDLDKSKTYKYGKDEDVIAKSMAAEFYASSKRELRDFVYAAMVDMTHEMIESFHENDFIDRDDLFKEIGKISDNDKYNASKAMQWLKKTRNTLKELYDVVEKHFGSNDKGKKNDESQKEIYSAIGALNRLLVFDGKPDSLSDLAVSVMFQPKGYELKKGIVDYMVGNPEFGKVVNQPIDKSSTIAKERYPSVDYTDYL